MRMNAEHAVLKFGEKLIGRKVYTQAIGSYPGGLAIVIQIAPDQAAPEIVFQVNNPSYGKMGIFAHEDIILEDTPTKELK